MVGRQTGVRCVAREDIHEHFHSSIVVTVSVNDHTRHLGSSAAQSIVTESNVPVCSLGARNATVSGPRKSRRSQLSMAQESSWNEGAAAARWLGARNGVHSVAEVEVVGAV